MRDRFVKTLIELARKDEKIYLITGDLGFGVLRPYWEEFPDRFINVGIAEQAMTGIAAGLAAEGNIVFTYSIGNFPTLRCLEQIRNDCAYPKANVKIVCVGGGFTYGALGMSHQATEDIAILRALPEVSVMAPADPKEAEFITKEVYREKGTCYLRLGRGGSKRIYRGNSEEMKFGKAIEIYKGKDIYLFSTGEILQEAKTAVERLRKEGLDIGLASFPFIKPLDDDYIKTIAQKAQCIFTIEEHNVLGGFGSAVAETVGELGGEKSKLIRIGIEDTYGKVVGGQDYLRNIYGLSAKKIFKRVFNESGKGSNKLYR